MHPPKTLEREEEMRNQSVGRRQSWRPPVTGLFLVALCFSTALSLRAQAAGPSPSDAAEGREMSAKSSAVIPLLDKALQTGRVQVIVGLQQVHRPEGALSAAEAQEQRRLIAASQRDLSRA